MRMLRCRRAARADAAGWAAAAARADSARTEGAVFRRWGKGMAFPGLFKTWGTEVRAE